MKHTHFLLIALLLTLQSLGNAAGTTAAKPMPPLANGGKPAYYIVVGRDATASELLAVAELGKYLGIVTGTAKDGVVKSYYGSPVAEGNQGSARCIYVGWTDFAKKNGLDGSTMQPEEWAVKTVGADLSSTLVLIEADSAEKLYDFPVVWKFRKDPRNEGDAAKWYDADPDGNWSDIRIDANWRTQEPGKDHRGTAWYSVTFTAPPLSEKTVGVDLLAADLRKLFLRFSAVDGQCWVWLDGKLVGSQTKPPEMTWDKPFAFDLGSEQVKPGQAQRLVVKVRKDSAAAGIYKPVELRVK